MVLPVGLVLVYSFYKFLARDISPDLTISDLKLDDIKDDEEEKVNKKDKRAVIFTLIVTISLWLSEPLHGIPVAATSAVPIVLLTLFQVVKAKEVRSLPWDTLMLVAGGLALGLAIVEVGLSTIIMENIARIDMPEFLLAAVLAIIGITLSNVMSNTAASAILVPLGLTLGGVFSVAAPLIIAISCSCALLLPVSTPANAISFATGMIEQKSFRKGGVFFLLLGPFTAFLVVMLWVWLLGK